MNKETMEHLSSLMDGELSHETGLFVVRRMGSDRQLGMAWERYHLIRECLRRPGDERAVRSLSVDLDTLPQASSESPRRAASWLRPVSGFAIAASVAVVAVMLTLDGATPVSQDEAGPVNEPFSSPNPLQALPRNVQPGLQPVSASDRQRLLLRHNQVAGAVGQQGFISFMPIVSTAPVNEAEQIEDESPAAETESTTEQP